MSDTVKTTTTAPTTTATMSIVSEKSDLLGLGSKMKEALSEQIAKTIAMDVGNKYSDYNCSRR